MAEALVFWMLGERPQLKSWGFRRSPTSKSVQSFALSNKKRISLFYIPSYSPELNPDEHIWSYLKTYELAAHQAQNKKELRKIVDTKMRKIAKKETLIQSFFMKKYMH